jgi:hypothetical protein
LQNEAQPPVYLKQSLRANTQRFCCTKTVHDLTWRKNSFIFGEGQAAAAPDDRDDDKMQLWNRTWVTTVLKALKAVQEHLLKSSSFQLVRRTQNIQLESILIFGFSPWQLCILIIMMSSFESW